MGLGRRRLARNRRGTYDLRLPEAERELLRWLVPSMRRLLVGADAAADPSLRRLFPPAYAEDPAADAEYRELMHDDLLAQRLEQLDVLETTADASELTGEQLDQWMRCVNDIRLVLGTRLDVTEEDQGDELDPDDPDAGMRAVYHYLGWLLGEIVDLLDR